MSPRRLPSAKVLHRICEAWEAENSDPATRREKVHSFLGVKIVAGPVHPFEASKWGAGKYIDLPEYPSFLQKMVAFLLIQLLFAEFARKENQWSNYAYRWNNAIHLFRW